MTQKRRIFLAILSAAGLLALLGCLFCFACPSRYVAPGSHLLFWRQLAWNGIGLSVCFLVWRVGWKRLIRAAPWLMAAWIAAYAAAQFSPAVHGVHRCLSFGPFRFTVTVCFLPVFALFAAWLHEKREIKPWMEWTAFAAVFAVAVLLVLGNENKMQRLAAFFGSGEAVAAKRYMTGQLEAAFSVSRWFGGAGRALDYLPVPESTSSFAASSLLFGKWFPAAVVSLFAVLGGALTCAWRTAEDRPGRRFLLLFGFWLLFPAAYGLLFSLGLLPVIGTAPALASYGGTNAVSAWFGIGVLFAVLDAAGRGGETGPARFRTVRVCFVWGAAALLAVFGIAVLSRRSRVFGEPRPADGSFGEFGLPARRGRILAADGTPFAYTVRAWQFHLDPCVADRAVYEPERLREIAAGRPDCVVVVSFEKPKTAHTGEEIASPVFMRIAGCYRRNGGGVMGGDET